MAGGGLHWFIARHYLGAGRGRGLLSLITWIALGGVTVGVTALVVVTAVMTGMQEDLQGKILESTPHVMVLEVGRNLRLHDWEAVAEKVRETEGVASVAPFVSSQVSIVTTVSGEFYSQPANLFGVRVDAPGDAPTDMEKRILDGVLSLETPESGLPPILMGSLLMDRMQLFAGDTVRLTSLESLRPGPFGEMVPRVRPFEVTGSFETGMFDYDMENIYAPLGASQDLVGITDSMTVGGLGISTTDPEIAGIVADQLNEELGYPFVAYSWITQNAALFSALKLEKIAMGLILFLIVVVAAFNIVSTLVMVVADRTREIGILKAMGMTKAGILRVFVLQGAWIGIVGTLVGTILGVLTAVVIDRYEIIQIPPDVYFVDHLPVSIQWLDILRIVLASTAVAFLATIYPAIQASRLEPVDAIRHD